MTTGYVVISPRGLTTRERLCAFDPHNKAFDSAKVGMSSIKIFSTPEDAFEAADRYRQGSAGRFTNLLYSIARVEDVFEVEEIREVIERKYTLKVKEV